MVGSAVLVTVTVTVMADVTEGALNTPLLDTVPALAVQLTELLSALFMRAVNCRLCPAVTVALDGEIAMLKIGFVGFALWLELEPAPLTPEHAELNRKRRTRKRFERMQLLDRTELFPKRQIPRRIATFNIQNLPAACLASAAKSHSG